MTIGSCYLPVPIYRFCLFPASNVAFKASVYTLETRMKEAGIDETPLWTDPGDWHSLGDLLDQWISTTAHHLARAAVAACAVIDMM